MTNDIDLTLNCVADSLRQARRVLFITGAGISAESGLPTYRGVAGLYNSGTTEEGYPIETCLSASMFSVRPELTWKYMLVIAEAVVRCKPNAAHEILAHWEDDFERRDGKLVILTQNIDGYHRRSGSRNVLEIHGSMDEMYCPDCEWKASVDPAGIDGSQEKRIAELKADFPPKCPWCGSVVRPRIVLFEEMLPRNVLDRFDREFGNGDGFDLVFAVGTSAMFPYITGPIHAATRAGKTTVEINPIRGDLSELVTHHIPLGATEALTRLDQRR